MKLKQTHIVETNAVIVCERLAMPSTMPLSLILLDCAQPECANLQSSYACGPRENVLVLLFSVDMIVHEGIELL